MIYKSKKTIFEKHIALSSDQTSLKAKFFLASFPPSKSSPILDKFLLGLEYIQLLYFTLLLTLFSLKNHESELVSTLIMAVRLLNPAHWMSFDPISSFQYGILLFMAIFTVFRLILLAYVVKICAQRFRMENLWIRLWGILMKFQGRLRYYLATCFYLNLIRTVDWETYEIRGSDQDKGLVTTAGVFIIVEFGVSLIPKMIGHYVLPTKSLLSSKTNVLEILTLVQKLISQILFVTMDFNKSSSSLLSFMAVNIGIDAVRNLYFFSKLPLYSFKSLVYQGRVLMVVSSLNLASFIYAVIKEIDDTFNGPIFFIILGIIFCILTVISSDNYLQRVFVRMITDPLIDRPDFLFHRLLAVKELLKVIRDHNDGKTIKNSAFLRLVYQTLISRLEKILWVEDGKSLDLNSKQDVKKIFGDYLEKLKDKYPKYEATKVYMANFYFNKVNLIGVPVRVCTALKRSDSGNVRMNAELVLYRIQGMIQWKNQQAEQPGYMDLTAFAKETSFVAKMKQLMLTQVKFQLDCHTEILKDTPNLELILRNSQKANHFRKKIAYHIEKMSQSISEHHVDPLLICAKYQIIVNYYLNDSLKFSKLYSQKLAKNQKFFSHEQFSKENLFQDTVTFFFLSGQKADAGTIIYASKNVEKLCGGDISQYSGLDICQRACPIYRSIYASFYKSLSEDPSDTLLGKTTKAFLYHIEDHIQEVEFFLDIHPYASQGFYFVLIFRPIFSSKEFLILHENGDVDCGTKDFIKKFGLTPKDVQTNIRSICEELVRVNMAFNMVAFPQKYERNYLQMTLKEAEEIYSLYSTAGNDILFTPLGKTGESYSYNCQIRNEIYGPLLIKVLTLEENKYKGDRNECGQVSGASLFEKRTEGRLTGLGAIEAVAEEEPEDDLEDDEDMFTTEEEKEEGWIDLGPFIERQERRRTFQIPLSPTSIMTSDRGLLTKVGGGVGDSENTECQLRTVVSPRVVKNEKKADFSDSKGTKQALAQRRAKSSLATSNLSMVSQKKKLSSIYLTSLGIKYYSKPFKALLILFYIGFMILAGLRGYLKISLDQNMKAFMAAKDVIRNNEHRNFEMIETATLARFIWQFYSGALDISAYSDSLALAYNVTRDFVGYNIFWLAHSNQLVFQGVGALDKETSQAIFTQNARIYSSYFEESPQSFVTVDSFQATNMFLQAALDLYDSLFDSVILPETSIEASLVFRNALNDLVLANDKITAITTDSFASRYNQIQNLLTIFIICLIIVTILILAVFTLFLYKQYVQDVFYISATCRVNNQKLMMVSQEIVSFKDALENDDITSKNWSSSHMTSGSKSPGKEHVKIPVTKDLRKKYYQYLGNIIVFLIGLVTFLAINSAKVKSPIKRINQRQKQLYFVDHACSEISLTMASFRELAATNNTAMIENEEALVKLEELTTELVSIRENIYDILLTDDILSEAPEIKHIIFEDGCQYLNETFQFYCEILKMRGQRTGAMYLLAVYEVYMRDKVDDYQSSNKTSAALEELQTENYDIITVVWTIVKHELKLISSILHEDFNKKVYEGDKSRTLNFSYTIVSIVFAAVLGWVVILKKLGGSVNEIKDILRVLPVDLTLSSFILKSFVIRTSNKTLDFIKNRI